ncbi:polysaccharide biosynthesis/export family protein [Sphingomicrobium lutaoense]|uniref:Polysaccharide export outer membrane protein n=1 Tax=Sphingomicrobium lutaoense TaxID=515949 RepID=A0A839Z6S5_9SPHN|nr:polysaccharide biosynthesis/export family protein [Sphingomicrobium lutaoense]MBB3764444.1 polysaccharide export outer membrane protein [Sphingomicrobium lutaoense]
MFKHASFLIAAAALAGCASSVGLDEGSTAVAVADKLPPPDPDALTRNFADYRIGANDEIEIAVFGVEEMTRKGTVDSAGYFSMPLAGAVLAGGKTPEELAKTVEDKLRGRYLKDPQVSVSIIEARANTVTVDGAVRQPGIYPIVGTLTLQQAVAMARGADETASLSRVIVFRQAGGQKMAAMFDLKDIRSGKFEDPVVFANDIVVVGESATRRFLRDLRTTIPTLGQFTPVL